MELFELSLNDFYKADLEQYFKIRDELNNSVMTPRRRELLENCKTALEAILEDFYKKPDWR